MSKKVSLAAAKPFMAAAVLTPRDPAPASNKVTLADCSATFERLEGILRGQVDGAEKLADTLAGSDGMKVGAALRPEAKGAIGALHATSVRIEDLLIALEGHWSRIAQAVG